MAKSFCTSTVASKPTATRIKLCLMPAVWRCASVIRPCDVLAGWQIKRFGVAQIGGAAQKLCAVKHMKRLFTCVHQGVPLFFTSNDNTAPPKPCPLHFVGASPRHAVGGSLNLGSRRVQRWGATPASEPKPMRALIALPCGYPTFPCL